MVDIKKIVSDIEGVSSEEDSESEEREQSFINLGDAANPTDSSEDDSESDHDEAELEPEAGEEVNEPEIPNAAIFGRGVEIGDETKVNPLSVEEIALIRMQLRENLVTRSERDRARGKLEVKPEPAAKEFRVPKDHPVFDGDVDKLEAFIEGMELTHAKYTTGSARNKSNPDFITKLLPYFKEGTPAHTWFRVYARKRTKAGLKLTWGRLVRDIRASYGVFDQPDTQFETYYTMMQKGDDIHTYIANKCEAAMMSDDLTPNILKFGFIRGLDPDVKKHVKLRKPKTVEDAQREAIEYENSTGGKAAKKSSSARMASKVSRGNGNGHGSGNGRRSGSDNNSSNGRKRNRDDGNKLSGDQKEALEELRRSRRNKCFGCGKDGHRRDDCKASENEIASFQEKVNKLKSKIKGSK
jgi:Ty3 transposon capsid-like protein